MSNGAFLKCNMKGSIIRATRYSHDNLALVLVLLGGISDCWERSRKPQVGDDGPGTTGRRLRYDSTVDNVHVLQKPFGNHFHCYGLLPESLQGFFI